MLRDFSTYPVRGMLVLDDREALMKLGAPIPGAAASSRILK